MAKINLTAGRVRDFKTPDGKVQAFLWDATAPGLGLRATAGAVAYIFQGKLARQVIRITIGDVKTWGLEEARDKAGDVVRPGAREEARRLQALLDQGIDPRQQKTEKLAETAAKQEAKKRKDATVGEAWDVYVEARRPKWSARHLLDHENLVKAGGVKRISGWKPGESDKTQPGPLAPLLPMKLCDLDADHVTTWLRDESAVRPTQAGLAFRLLRAFVRWCADQKEYQNVIHAEACSARISKDTLPKAGVKDDCLQKQQLPCWFAAVQGIQNPVIAAYLQALLLTGARREELAGTKWIDLDFQWKAIIIHDKVEGERTIPLTPYVAHLLAALPRRNEWVFSSPSAESGRLQEPSIQHRRVTTAASIEGLTLHGLRRSFGTLSEWCEVPTGVVAQIMGHKPSAIAEKHYRRRPLDLLRMWHEKIEAWILEEAGVQFDADQTAAGLRLVERNDSAA